MPNHHRIYIELNTYSEYIWTQYIAGGVWYQLSHDVLPGTSAGHVKLQKSEWEDKDMHQDINDYSSIIHSLSHAYWVSHSWHIYRWHVSPQIPTNDWTLFIGRCLWRPEIYQQHGSHVYWALFSSVEVQDCSIFLNLPLAYMTNALTWMSISNRLLASRVSERLIVCPWGNLGLEMNDELVTTGLWWNMWGWVLLTTWGKAERHSRKKVGT